MEQLVHETKGGSKRRMVFSIIAVFAFLLLALFAFTERNAKREGLTVGSGYLDSNGKFVQTSSGKAGGDKYTKEGKDMLLVLGVGSLLIAAFSADMAVGNSRCWIKVYDKHVEGQRFAAGFQKSKFYCTHDQIQSTQLMKDAVRFDVGSQKYLITCQEPQKLFEALRCCRSGK